MTAQFHDGNLLQPPLAQDMIALDPAFGTRFMLFVDTEEEFDWDAPFNRASDRVTALAGMARGQAYFAAAGVKPIYVTDYPVIDSDAAATMMGQWISDGAADIGAHLHPWVNPPHVEDVNAANSYVGFLPEAVERAKLEALCQRIEARFGRRPIAYRAGRYGVGPNSARLLEEAGFRLDSSVRSRFDYSHQHGPDFRGLPQHPYWAGPTRLLIELPLSTAFAGLLRGGGERLYRAAQAIGPLAGALSRARMFSRIPLTPEGVPLQEAIAAIDALMEEGVRVLNFSFHSPTLEPGHTPYVAQSARSC
ncbi:polysaccharide deacetylase family protein, partial [Sphingobium sp. Z007]|uniref:polysaccharide deacetylase family protein n=2 Tax=Sphingobium sp. Z007 TaxID=627495 RepID=UPI000B4A4722